DRGSPEARSLLGDHEIAREREAHTASQHVAGGREERGVAEPRHQPEELEEEVRGKVLLDERRIRREAAQVGARAEDLVPRPGEDHSPDRLVVASPLDRLDQGREQLPVEGVPLVRPVQRDGRDAVMDVIEELLSHGTATLVDLARNGKCYVLLPTAGRRLSGLAMRKTPVAAYPEVLLGCAVSGTPGAVRLQAKERT